MHTCPFLPIALLDGCLHPLYHLHHADSVDLQVEADNLDTTSAAYAARGMPPGMLALQQYCFVHTLTLHCMNACTAKTRNPLQFASPCVQVGLYNALLSDMVHSGGQHRQHFQLNALQTYVATFVVLEVIC